MSEPGMVIVGSGKAAARAVVGLREHGWKGSITLIGEEKHLPYDLPPLSKAAITAAEEPQPVLLLDESMLGSLGVTRISGVAVAAIDRVARAVTLADGRSIPYARLLIATGARARKLNISGGEHARTLRSFEDSVALRAAFTPGRRIAIIGGGFIGLELAASASKRGCAVTVVEAQPRILMRGVPQAISDVVAARHKAAGVTILTGAIIDRIEKDGVVLSGGRKIAANVIVAGIGAAPEVSLAQAAGLTIDNGIVCNALLQTGDPDIFAAGDCCSFPHGVFGNRRLRLEAWRSAQDQGAVAAENMLGGGKAYEAIPWFWSDQFELTLQIAGVPGDGTSSVRRQVKEDAFILFHLDGTGVLVGASGIGPGNSIARDIRLAEMLTAKRAAPHPAQLADPAVQLKSLLKG
jgi:3-phenylpropionate/trans-cinnamate dioxygenase ferredoxin reductase component